MLDRLLDFLRQFIGSETILTLERQDYGVDQLYGCPSEVHRVAHCPRLADTDDATPITWKDAKRLDECQFCFPDTPGVVGFAEYHSFAEVGRRSSEFHRERREVETRKRLAIEAVAAPHIDPGVVMRLREAESTLNLLPQNLADFKNNQHALNAACRLEKQVARFVKAMHREIEEDQRKEGSNV